ncbi:hypothetical protein ABZ402_49455 [Streptomyces mirabilis]|uniref:hypothetical protein n=1 Tax=Streptomyces mirabilis TaxID=68239 RepID=UPI0033D7880F
MKGAGQLDRGCQRGEARDIEFGAQRSDLVVDAVAAGIADEFGPADVDGGGAQVEAAQELVGEVDFRGGLVGGVERDGECAQGLAVGGLAGLAVLFGFGASGEVGRGGTLGLALQPVQFTQHALVAAFPAEILGGGEGGGEVGGDITVSGLARAARVDRSFLYRLRDLLERAHAAAITPTEGCRLAAVSRTSLQADLANALERNTRLDVRVQKRLSEQLGEQAWRESGLGSPPDIDQLRRHIAMLEQELVEKNRELEDRTEELEAARAANRELTRRNHRWSRIRRRESWPQPRERGRCPKCGSRSSCAVIAVPAPQRALRVPGAGPPGCLRGTGRACGLLQGRGLIQGSTPPAGGTSSTSTNGTT